MSEENNDANDTPTATSGEPTTQPTKVSAETVKPEQGGQAPSVVELPKATNTDIIKTQANSLGLTIAEMIQKREALNDEIYRLGVIKTALENAANISQGVSPLSEVKE